MLESKLTPSRAVSWGLLLIPDSQHKSPPAAPFPILGSSSFCSITCTLQTRLIFLASHACLLLSTSDNLHVNLGGGGTHQPLCFWPHLAAEAVLSCTDQTSRSPPSGGLDATSCFPLLSFISQTINTHLHHCSDFWFSGTRLPWCSCPVFVNMCGHVLQNSGRSGLLVIAEIFQRNSLTHHSQCPGLLLPSFGCLSPPPP